MFLFFIDKYIRNSRYITNIFYKYNPDTYFDAVVAELKSVPADAFGGPDRAHSSFTDVQKAINYSMTSFFTTGGIRGGKRKMDKFYPRSFNMGVRREVYN